MRMSWYQVGPTLFISSERKADSPSRNDLSRFPHLILAEFLFALLETDDEKRCGLWENGE